MENKHTFYAIDKFVSDTLFGDPCFSYYLAPKDGYRIFVRECGKRKIVDVDGNLVGHLPDQSSWFSSIDLCLGYLEEIGYEEFLEVVPFIPVVLKEEADED